jgi:hypothetical protein
MDDWFAKLPAAGALAPDAAGDLERLGFTLIPGPVPECRLAELSEAYDAAIASARPEDVGQGATTIRVHGLVNVPAFDALYVFPPLLDACRLVLGRPFQLSSLLARTVRPGAPAQSLHVDSPADARGWSMVGFILMVDPFHPGNGATRLVPGSHLGEPDRFSGVGAGDCDGQVLACAPAGAVVVYNGAVWHGHTANASSLPRRSVQGAFIHLDARQAVEPTVRVRHETRARVGPVARHVLGLG